MIRHGPRTSAEPDDRGTFTAMRPFQPRKKSFFVAMRFVDLGLAFVTLAASLSLVALAGACGGKPDGDVKAPGDGTGASSGASSSGASSAAAAAAERRARAETSGGASGGTTTTTLPDGGELQGAKLGDVDATRRSRRRATAVRRPAPATRRSRAAGARTSRPSSMARRDEARACYDKGAQGSSRHRGRPRP